MRADVSESRCEYLKTSIHSILLSKFAAFHVVSKHTTCQRDQSLKVQLVQISVVTATLYAKLMPVIISSLMLLLLFTHQVVSDSLQPRGLQDASLPCPSPSPGACPSLCPLNWFPYILTLILIATLQGRKYQCNFQEIESIFIHLLIY